MALPKNITEEYSVIRAGWDASTTPIMRNRAITSSALLSRDDDDIARYRLSDEVRYRKESFGAVISLSGVSTNFFNESAASLLAACREPKTFKKIVSSLSNYFQPPITSEVESSLRKFVQECTQVGLLEIVTDIHPSSAQFYFLREDTSSKPHFYMPLAAEIEITNKCFRQCSYCAYESGPHPKIQPEHELTTQQCIQVIDEFAEEGLFALEFTGGDPFVRSDAFEIMQYASQKGISLLINSDLSILDEKHLEELANLKSLVAVQTSLDGATAESCDFTRGRGGFKTLVLGLTH